MMPLEMLASPLMRNVFASVGMLAYGIPDKIVDEYVRMSESTCLASMYKFYKAIVAVSGPQS